MIQNVDNQVNMCILSDYLLCYEDITPDDDKQLSVSSVARSFSSGTDVATMVLVLLHCFLSNYQGVIPVELNVMREAIQPALGDVHYMFTPALESNNASRIANQPTRTPEDPYLLLMESSRRQNVLRFDFRWLVIMISRIQGNLRETSCLDAGAGCTLDRRWQWPIDAMRLSASASPLRRIQTQDMFLVLARNWDLSSGSSLRFGVGTTYSSVHHWGKALNTPTFTYTVDVLAALADYAYNRALLRISHRERARLLPCAWNLYQRAVTATVHQAGDRFHISLRWALHATHSGNLKVALQAYAFAVGLLPFVVMVEENSPGRIDAVRRVSYLAASSVSTALTVGDVPMAFDFLERSRGILWMQSFRARDTETSPLQVPWRERLLDGNFNRIDRLPWTPKPHKTEDLFHIISNFRTFPGLARFQLPPSLEEIQLELKHKGAYAVIVVPCNRYCDMIVLGLDSSNPQACHLRLPGINAERAHYLSKDFRASCSIARAVRQSTIVSRAVKKVPIPNSGSDDPMMPLLSELWTALVQPLVQHIADNTSASTNNRTRKRLWWCPTGTLSSLPLHAAGIYDGMSQDDLRRHFISSYAPTITGLYRLLLAERSVSKSPCPFAPKVLLVCQPSSSNLPIIGNVKAEIQKIKTIIPNNFAVSLYEEQGATIHATLEGLKSADVLHIACHGYQDQVDPLNSGFELKDGRLTLGQLMRLDNANARLAYLSACDSAGMDESRPDESLSVVVSMLFAGFRSVICTMWTMDDLDGPFMASRIYGRIFKDSKLDMSAVAYAVDDAVRQLRESGVPASRWATYTHFGV